MKKSLLAVAAMTAFAGAAHAQSSVTIYGVLDESYSYLKQTDRASLNKTTQGLKDSAWTSNRLGFQGSEDLGGGSSAVFTVESGLAVANAGPEQAGLGNTGANSNFGTAPFTNVRQAFLGVKNTKFGQLTAGYQYTQEYFQRITNIGGSANTLGIAATSSNGGIAVTSRGTIDQYNGFRYESPAYMGAQFVAMVGTVNLTQQSAYGTALTSVASTTGQGMYIAGVDPAAAITQNGTAQSYGVQWTQGKAQATVSMSKENAFNASSYSYYLGGANTSIVATMTAINTQQTNVTASGSYDFGIVKLMGIAANRRITTASTSAVANVDMYNIGAFVPVTPTIKLGVNYAYAHQGLSGNDTKNQAYQASVQYSLSKRSTAYLLAARASASAISGNVGATAASTLTTVTSANQYVAGFTHSF
jgi:predicted porin